MFAVSQVRYEELSVWGGFRQAWSALPACFAVETLTVAACFPLILAQIFDKQGLFHHDN